MDEVDDLFHDVVMSEEIQRNGYEEGRAIGRNQGEREGKRLGWEKGSSIGSEVGFIAGYAASLLEEMKGKDDAKPRVVKTLEKLLVVTSEFNFSDPQNPELQTKLEEIRTKFKHVCSLLNIKPEASKSQEKGISF
ncbi:Oral cancer-overexpressed protein 1 [Mactra antiquata]